MVAHLRFRKVRHEDVTLTLSLILVCLLQFSYIPYLPKRFSSIGSDDVDQQEAKTVKFFLWPQLPTCTRRIVLSFFSGGSSSTERKSLSKILQMSNFFKVLNFCGLTGLVLFGFFCVKFKLQRIVGRTVQLPLTLFSLVSYLFFDECLC